MDFGYVCVVQWPGAVKGSMKDFSRRNMGKVSVNLTKIFENSVKTFKPKTFRFKL